MNNVFKVFLLVWVCAFVSSTQAQAWKLQIKSNNEEIQKDAKDFFDKKFGEELPSKQAISIAMKQYYFRWPIRNIQATQEQQTLIINIVPEYRITDIEIKGNKTIKRKALERQIRSFEAEYIGHDFKQGLENFLKEYYAYRGFPFAQLDAYLISQKNPGSLKLILRVQEEQDCEIERLEIVNIGDPLRKNIHKALRKTTQGRCDRELITDELEEIRKDLVDDLYRKASVALRDFEWINDRKQAVVIIFIDLGPRLEVRFEGNTLAYEREEVLEKEIFLEQEKRFNQTWLKASAIDGLEGFYQNHGFAHVEVDSSRKQHTTKDIEILHFDIAKGEVVRLGDITFEGNEAYSDKQLKKKFKDYAPPNTRQGFYVKSELGTIADRLGAYYQSKGYLRAKVLEPQIQINASRTEASVKFEIQEDVQSLWDTPSVVGNTVFDDETIIKKLGIERNEPIDPVTLKANIKSLERDYKVKGYKYAHIPLPNLQNAQQGLTHLTIQVEEGNQIQIGEILVRGNATTHAKVVTRELTFDTGDIYNINQIERSKANLFQLGFFLSIVFYERPRENQPDVEDIIITVQERKKRLLVLRPGISSDDGYRFSASLGYTNIAGTGRSATLSGRINRQIQNAEIVERRFVLTYLEPQIFNFVDGKITLIDEKADEVQFDISRQSFILGLERQWRRFLRTTLQWELEFRDPFNIDGEIVLSPFDETEARFGSLATIIDLDFRDNILNAEQGTFHRLRFEWFDRNLLSDAEFYRVFSTNSFYIPIYRRFRTLISIRAGFSGTRGQTSADGIEQVPIEKRFRLGGNDSLRGFQRNCVGGLGDGVAENCANSDLEQAPGGNSMINYLWDILIPLTDAIDLVLFTDGGNAFLTNGDWGLNDLRHTAGVGFRYNTFVGPLRIDYGIKLDRKTGESFGQLHFAVGQF
jgi:outer membrane protein insertion porin family